MYDERSQRYTYDNYPMTLNAKYKRSTRFCAISKSNYPDNRASNYVIDENGIVRLVDYYDISHYESIG